MTNDVPDWSTQIIRPDTIPAGSPWPYPTGTTIKNFPVLKGSHVFTVVVPDSTNVSFVQVIGHTSGITYLTAYPPTDYLHRPYYLIVSSEIDATLDVSVTATVSGTLYAASVGDVPAVAIAQQSALPWQAPNRTPAMIAMGYPGSGAATVVLASPGAGKSLWLHSMTYRWTSVAGNCFGKWQSTGGTDMIWEAGATMLDPVYYSLHGVQLPQNEGFQFLGQGSGAVNASFLQGTIVYSVF